MFIHDLTALHVLKNVYHDVPEYLLTLLQKIHCFLKNIVVFILKGRQLTY